MNPMKRLSLLALVLTLGLAQAQALAYQGADDKPAEREGAVDPLFLPRLPDAVATDQMRRDYTEYQLPVGWDAEVDDWKTRPVEARLTQTYYDHEKRSKLTELTSWYLANLKKHGFKVEFDHKFPDGARRIVAGADRGGLVVFDLDFRPGAAGPQLTLTMLDAGQDFRPEYDAEALMVQLARSDRVRLRDVRFDARGAVAPQSALQLDEVALMLKLDPKLKVRIEVATDEAGNPKKNLTLSSKRAQAVRSWLAKHARIPAARLIPVGLGDTKAVEGQDAPRWVELVKDGPPAAMQAVDR
jgi:outer membrane protein OmpA-like peptidoglycan-associated protein